MEDYKNDWTEKREKEIIYSKSVKAGKRIYYLDVKKSRTSELYMAITESKKKVVGDAENPDVSYEKHKLFLYQEDMNNFMEAMQDVVNYVKEKRPDVPDRERYWKKEENTMVESETDWEDAHLLEGPLEINFDDLK